MRARRVRPVASHRSNEHVLLTDALQDIYDEANYTYRHGDGEAAVDELAARVRGLLDHCEASVEEFHDVMLRVYERRIVNGQADDDGFDKFHPNNYAAMRRPFFKNVLAQYVTKKEEHHISTRRQLCTG